MQDCFSLVAASRMPLRHKDEAITARQAYVGNIFLSTRKASSRAWWTPTGGDDEFRSIATCHSHIRSCSSHPPNKAGVFLVCVRAEMDAEKERGREKKEKARKGSIEAFTLPLKERMEGRKKRQRGDGR